MNKLYKNNDQVLIRFYYRDEYKNLLLMRDLITLQQLKNQARQLYRIPEDGGDLCFQASIEDSSNSYILRSEN